MKIIVNGEVVEVGGGSGCITMDEVNAAIQSAVADIQLQEVYSAEEQRIGTWIDGKPVYRRVITGETAGAAKANKLLLATNNIDSLLYAYGAIKGAKQVLIPEPYANVRLTSIDGVYGICVWVNDATLTSLPCWAIVHYTKKDDSLSLEGTTV